MRQLHSLTVLVDHRRQISSDQANAAHLLSCHMPLRRHWRTAISCWLQFCAILRTCQRRQPNSLILVLTQSWGHRVPCFFLPLTFLKYNYNKGKFEFVRHVKLIMPSDSLFSVEEATVEVLLRVGVNHAQL